MIILLLGKLNRTNIIHNTYVIIKWNNQSFNMMMMTNALPDYFNSFIRQNFSLIINFTYFRIYRYIIFVIVFVKIKSDFTF